jgi:imidazolonepropionase-like amidohydrolase
MRETCPGPKSSLYLNQEGINGVTGVDVADGTQECIKAVRRQIGAGADWIKVIVTFHHYNFGQGAHIYPLVSVMIATLYRSMQVNESWFGLDLSVISVNAVLDYAVRSQASEVSRRVGAASMATFDFDELKAMISTAHAYGVKVAAHATNRSTIIPLINLRVDSIEHAYDMNTPDTTAVKMFERYVGCKTKYVPTLAAYYTMTQGKGEIWDCAVSSFKC